MALVTGMCGVERNVLPFGRVKGYRAKLAGLLGPGGGRNLALARLARWNPGLVCWGLSATLGNLDEAAHSLGVSGLAMLRRVHLPMLRGHGDQGLESGCRLQGRHYRRHLDGFGSGPEDHHHLLVHAVPPLSPAPARARGG